MHQIISVKVWENISLGVMYGEKKTYLGRNIRIANLCLTNERFKTFFFIKVLSVLLCFIMSLIFSFNKTDLMPGLQYMEYEGNICDQISWAGSRQCTIASEIWIRKVFQSLTCYWLCSDQDMRTINVLNGRYLVVMNVLKGCSHCLYNTIFVSFQWILTWFYVYIQ